MHKWTITTEITGKKRKVEVIIYERISDLKGAVTKYEQRFGSQDLLHADTLAVCHSFSKKSVGPKGSNLVVELPLTNIIRFSRDHLNPLVISHEFAHAAQHIYGLDYPEEWAYTMHGGNEEFARLYSELFNAFWPVVSNLVTYKKTGYTKI